jgi:hypothetical protein
MLENQNGIPDRKFVVAISEATPRQVVRNIFKIQKLYAAVAAESEGIYNPANFERWAWLFVSRYKIKAMYSPDLESEEINRVYIEFTMPGDHNTVVYEKFIEKFEALNSH